jgi:hypothetical protein
MVIRILGSSATFNGINYNFEKLALGTAELMSIRNFGALQGLDGLRQEDYKNYLRMISAGNNRVKLPQLHAVVSAKAHSHTKHELTALAIKWMAGMGYEDQPCLVFFHRDTGNNHVHIVSTRVGRDGKKISSAYEHIRAVNVMNKLMGLDENQQVLKDIAKAKVYKFSTIAQFKMLLENMGYKLKDNDVIRFGKKLAQVDYDRLELREADAGRARQLQAIFRKYISIYDFERFEAAIHEQHGVQLMFHAKDGKAAYGYTIIDHAKKNVFKGSVVMSLRELMNPANSITPVSMITDVVQAGTTPKLVSIHLAADIDDEAIHGAKRRRKQKARSHTR